MKDPKKYAKEKFQKQAEELMGDPRKIIDLLGKAKVKISKNKSILDEVLDDLLALIRMIKAYFLGEYMQVNTQKLVLIVMGILYFVVPTDLVLDFIPGIGFLDDVAVITWVVGHVKEEINEFKKFESTV